MTDHCARQGGFDRPVPSKCQQFVFLAGACICTLLLGLHLGQSRVFWQGPRAFRLNGIGDSRPNGSAVHQHGSGNATGVTAPAQNHSTLKAQPWSRGKPRIIFCNELPVQKQGYVTYNPAAIFDAERGGWLVMMRQERQGHWAEPSPPLAMRLGVDPQSLNTDTAADSQFLFELDNATLGDATARKRYDRPWLKTEDWRPFKWKGNLYAAHSMWGGMDSNGKIAGVWVCISALDLDRRRMSVEYCFDKLPIRNSIHSEKNWAVAAAGNASELLILHELAQCVTFLRYAPAASKGLELLQMTCYSDEVVEEVADFAGTALTKDLHLSGHLVEFPRPLALLDARRRGLPEDPVPEKEWFVMAHTHHDDGHRKRQVYSHWGFRIDAATLQLTHVSRGPVVSSYMDAGDPHDYVVVCSYHFTMTAGRHSLLAFFGRRDSQACYDWVDIEATAWYRVPPGRTVNVSDSSAHGYLL